MTGGESHVSGNEVESYELTMDALSSLITKRSRADKSNSGDRFDLLFDYLKILQLDEAIAAMKVIHVAGTKGKGSTCTFTESILRNCGFRTGLFTSPHLIDVRERFCLDGSEICKDKFMKYFWWCYHKLKDRVTEDLPMPTYFRFLTLLAFKIFAEEKVDVAILEVGLGGTFDATNVVPAPVVCGISSLGYDHMEILGDTLQQIAAEKAGIFKHGAPAFTVDQPEEAMRSLEQKASKLNVSLDVALPLDLNSLDGQKLGLDGEHQYVNAGLAVALSCSWLRRTGHVDILKMCDSESRLPNEFVRGLAFAKMQGRAQIVRDELSDSEKNGNLLFYLDGAHSPESMDVCGRWFSLAVKRGNYHLEKTAPERLMRILLFNCMAVRDPQVLLPGLVRTCSNNGVEFNRAIFVPNASVYNKVGHQSGEKDSDLSWQLRIQKVWEAIKADQSDATTMVMPSLQMAINRIREMAQRNQTVQHQVLVTGSLHLIGDVLRFIRK